MEAAVALQMLLSGQEERAEKYVEPHIRPITLELLNIIRETENDELTTVMQKIVSTYTEQLMPVAVEICQHLVTTFGQVIGHDEESDERAITAMGLLNTIETLIAVMEDHEDVLAQLEPVALQVYYNLKYNKVSVIGCLMFFPLGCWVDFHPICYGILRGSTFVGV